QGGLRTHHDCVRPLLRQFGEAALDLRSGRVAQHRLDQRQSQFRGVLAQLRPPRRIGALRLRIDDGDARRRRKRLFQELEAFAGDLEPRINADPGQVAAGPCEIGDITEQHRVSHLRHDRYRAGRRPERRHQITQGDDDIRLPAHDRMRHVGVAVDMPFGREVFDRQILSLGVAQAAQFREDRVKQWPLAPAGGGKRGMRQGETALLGGRLGRQCGRGMHCGQTGGDEEVAASHSMTSSARASSVCGTARSSALSRNILRRIESAAGRVKPHRMWSQPERHLIGAAGLLGARRVRTAIRRQDMAVVETERHGQILVVRMNRPERLNALSHEMRTQLPQTRTEFRHSNELEVAIFTGTGRGFCAGEDMKESLAAGQPGGKRPDIEDPFMTGVLEKPVIAAVNGFAMGGGFMLVERTDLRVAVKGAVFEVSEAKRWLLGGYNHGHIANVPYPIAMEMALAFRFTAERFYEIGFLNRLTEPDDLIPTAIAMAEHLLTLPPASRVNTVHMMRQMRPIPNSQQQKLAAALHEHGAKSDLLESRAAFAEKRRPNFKGWNDPQDRYKLPTMDKV